MGRHNKAVSPNTTQVPASKTKLTGQISAFGMACVEAGVIPQSTQLPTLVDEVKRGSKAFYAGVVAGDRILQATIDKDTFSLKIERNGKVYLAVMRPQMDINQQGLQGGSSADKLKNALRYFQIRLVIDHSGSMYRPLGNSAKLRWTWVNEEVSRFCKAVESRVGSNFDLYLFNETVDARLNKSANSIQNILEKAVTTGNTYLPAALVEATADSPRPLLIILITDGQAVSSKENGTILADALSRNPVLRQSRFVFLQTGFSAEGANFVAGLNDALCARGMGKQAYVVLFEEASQKGILGAIEPLITK
ncbi:MAG: VWA domain-containing protein [Candidatus Obscuribacterales bacterium]|nr:VWA domain-containing protein [Candidatus Obscuribacterales bacterium]